MGVERVVFRKWNVPPTRNAEYNYVVPFRDVGEEGSVGVSQHARTQLLTRISCGLGVCPNPDIYVQLSFWVSMRLCHALPFVQQWGTGRRT